MIFFKKDLQDATKDEQAKTEGNEFKNVQLNKRQALTIILALQIAGAVSKVARERLANGEFNTTSAIFSLIDEKEAEEASKNIGHTFGFPMPEGK